MDQSCGRVLFDLLQIKELKCRQSQHFQAPTKFAAMDLQEAKASFIDFFSFWASIPDHEKNCFDWQKQMHVKDCCSLVEAIRNDNDKDLLATYVASFVLLPGDTQTSQLQQIIQGQTFPGGGTRTYAIPVSGHKSIHLCATSTKNIFEL